MLRTGGHLRALLVPGETLASPGNEATSPKGPNQMYSQNQKTKEGRAYYNDYGYSFFLFFLPLTYYTPSVKKS